MDWYEAYADTDGERVKLYAFSMRSLASGTAFHRAYPCATQQAFLEAHELAFANFEGVLRVLRYDNLSSAVKISRSIRSTISPLGPIYSLRVSQTSYSARSSSWSARSSRS